VGSVCREAHCREHAVDRDQHAGQSESPRPVPSGFEERSGLIWFLSSQMNTGKPALCPGQVARRRPVDGDLLGNPVVPLRFIRPDAHEGEVAERLVDGTEAARTEPTQKAGVALKPVVDQAAAIYVPGRGDSHAQTGHPAGPDEILVEDSEPVGRQRVDLGADLVVVAGLGSDHRHR